MSFEISMLVDWGAGEWPAYSLALAVGAMCMEVTRILQNDLSVCIRAIIQSEPSFK